VNGLNGTVDFEAKAIMICDRTLGQGVACGSKMFPEFFRTIHVCSVSIEDYKSLALAQEKMR
jgi:formylmethanofuran dehydrogenase subunit D